MTYRDESFLRMCRRRLPVVLMVAMGAAVLASVVGEALS